jgi:hypothetical protein
MQSRCGSGGRSVRRNSPATGVCRVNNAGGVLAYHAFQDVPGSAIVERAQYVAATGVCRERHNTRLRERRPNRTHRLNTAATGHRQIHQRDIRQMQLEGGDGIVAIRSFGDNINSGIFFQNAAQTATKHWMIIDDQYT